MDDLADIIRDARKGRFSTNLPSAFKTEDSVSDDAFPGPPPHKSRKIVGIANIPEDDERRKVV